MNGITENLKQLVKEEADKLKLNARPEELAALNFEDFSPNFAHSCIYGQMTGSCQSTRAFHLLTLCATPFASDIDEFEEPKAFDFSDRLQDKVAYELFAYSPIEFYIAQEGAKNDNLIAYLKGESNTLDL